MIQQQLIQQEIRIPWNPHKKQLQFQQSKAKYKAFIGGIGSGKTRAGCIESLGFCLENPKCLFFIGAPTYPMLRDATKRTFLEICPQELIKKDLIGTNILTLINGSEILFRSCEDPEKLRGPNLAGFWIDEGALVPEMAWRILIGRLRQAGFNYIGMITTTPKGYNWIHEKFVVAPNENYEIIICSTLDNPYLPKEFIEDLKKNYTGVFAKQEIYGDFVGFEGLVYPEFINKQHVGRFKELDFKYKIAGVDWGIVHKFVILVAGIG